MPLTISIPLDGAYEGALFTTKRATSHPHFLSPVLLQ
jgi:hypothetical protein